MDYLRQAGGSLVSLMRLRRTHAATSTSNKSARAWSPSFVGPTCSAPPDVAASTVLAQAISGLQVSQTTVKWPPSLPESDLDISLECSQVCPESRPALCCPQIDISDQ